MEEGWEVVISVFSVKPDWNLSREDTSQHIKLLNCRVGTSCSTLLRIRNYEFEESLYEVGDILQHWSRNQLGEGT